MIIEEIGSYKPYTYLCRFDYQREYTEVVSLDYVNAVEKFCTENEDTDEDRNIQSCKLKVFIKIKDLNSPERSYEVHSVSHWMCRYELTDGKKRDLFEDSEYEDC